MQRGRRDAGEVDRAVGSERQQAAAGTSHALNMRWRTIFDRIDGHAELFAAVLRSDGIRGAAGHHKRRRIVVFVRERPEELRPYAASGGRSA